MSGSYLYKTQEEKYQYIKEVFNTLIIRESCDGSSTTRVAPTFPKTAKNDYIFALVIAMSRLC